MKIVKYIFLLLLLSAIAVTVFIATQEGKYDIRKERVINVPKALLYNYINEYRNWESTGIITNTDTTATYSYSENTFGKDASMTWKKDGTEGKISTIKLIENDSILQKATIDGLDSELAWGFKDTIGGTKVTVRMQGQLSFKEKAYAVLNGNVNEKMEAALDNGLKNLNTYLVEELGKYNVEVKGLVTKTGVFYVGQPVKSKISELQKKSGEIFPKLMSFVKTNKILTNGAPFILYKSFSKQKDSASYVICIPIKEEMYTMPGSEYEGGKVASFQALKTTLKGDYSHLAKAWDAAQKHVAEKGLQENTTGQYIELYSKGIQQTKSPSEWVTDIYIPIGAPTIVPPTETITETLPGVVPAAKPGTTTPKPAVNKPATGTQKPAGTTSTGNSATARPAANKPAGTTSGATTKSTATKPAQSTATPAQKPANP